MQELEAELWREIGRATVDRKHPFRYPSLASMGNRYPELRTVVLRGREEKSLFFYTDYRSAKCEEVLRSDFASVLCYHPRKQVQARLKGRMIVHHQNELAREHLSQLPPGQRKDYQSITAPGRSFEGHAWQEELAFENFCVLEFSVAEIDHLILKRGEGHQRYYYRYDAAGNLSEYKAIQA